MKFKEFKENILYEEADEYVLVEDELDYIDHSGCRAYRYAIIKSTENGRHFRVHYWSDSADYGIYPEDDEELDICEVESVQVVTQAWKPKKG
jgi:hypothetical protein